MSTKDDVLSLLAQNTTEYMSGESIAKNLGVSRAAVWKAIKSLQKAGYTIDAVTNRGYMLNKGSDVLDADAIGSRLNFECKIKYYPTIDSTNTQAKRLITDGESDTMLVVAEEQTAGRGRQGKSFYSPANTGIYMSFVIHPMSRLENAVTATTAAAVAVCKAVESLTDKKPRIKWVNDVYLDGKKICGILTEAVTDFETQTVTSVIIGVGMNIRTTEFPDDVENASCLGVDINRADLISAIANELNSINTDGYAEFIDYYRSHSMIIGEDILFIKDGSITPATAVGIDARGGLEVELKNGERTVLRSGEISIRKRVD